MPEYQGKCEAIFCTGNGYLGQRAALEERYVGQTRDLLVTGTFNRFAENEVTELPNLPDVTNLEFYVDGVRFAMDEHNTSGYLRVLDLQTGEVRRTLTWTHPDGRRFALCFARFASMDNEHILGIKASITALDGDAGITVVSGIDGRVTSGGSQHFLDGDKRIFDNTILRMSVRTNQSGVTCCLHSAHGYAINGESVQGKRMPIVDRRYMAMKAAFDVKAGQTLSVAKLTAVTTSRDLAYHGLDDTAEMALKDGLEILRMAVNKGYDRLFEESCEKWVALWKQADIKIDSKRPFDQLLIRFALYHLNIMIKKDDSRVGIGAKGLTGEGYKGHSFWDTEIFILPYFIFTQPKAARTLHDSSLSKSTHCVLAADLGEEKTAYDFFTGCGSIDLGGAMTTSDMGVHTASMGGIWQCVAYGFGGVRVVGKALHINPHLPENWDSLALPLCWRGQALRLTADKQRVRLTNAGNAEVRVVLCGNHIEIAPGETVKREYRI